MVLVENVSLTAKWDWPVKVDLGQNTQNHLWHYATFRSSSESQIHLWNTSSPCNALQCNAMHYTKLHITIQYNVLQCNTIHYNTMQYNTMQYNTRQCIEIQYNTIHYNIKQHITIQYHTIYYNTMDPSIPPNGYDKYWT